MKTLTKILGTTIIALSFSTISALALDTTVRGPLPFTAFDMNNDGAISEEEFDDTRAKRQAALAAEGRQLRNAANAPEFAAIDTDKDGKISQAEFAKGHAMHGRRASRGYGMGQRRGMGQGRGMGRGRGMGMGRGRKMIQ